MKIYLYHIEDKYIEYLKTFDIHVSDSKVGKRKHRRKYIGAVLEINNTKYFAPLSSPKPKDYETDGLIRKDPIFLTRIIVKNEQNIDELKAKIMLSNMIPICESAIKKYDPSKEIDLNYKTLVIKELDFITKNRKKILEKAKVIYFQKTGLYKVGTHCNYLSHTINFKLLEQKSKLYKK